MTTMHMDVAAARAIQVKLLQLHDSISRIINQSNNAVLGLPPQWQGTSADLFFERYNENSSVISGVASELSEIALDLANEIAAWERMADGLSN